MCGIVFENVRNWCLFHYKKFVRPVRPYHWGTLTQLPVTQTPRVHGGVCQWPTCCTTPLGATWQDPGHGRFEWQPFRQLQTQNIRDFALWYSRFRVDCLLAAPMVVGAAFLILKCISPYLDCQYDSLSIDKCSKMGHRGPRYEEMLTNEKFIMKLSAMIITFTPSLHCIIKRNSNLSITHS